MAAFQSSATSAFLPAAKSGSSCAQSASDPIAPMVVQTGQASGAIFASVTGSAAPGQPGTAFRPGDWVAA